MKTFSKHGGAALIIGSAIVSMFALAGTAFAATSVEPVQHANFARPAVIGTVSAVNGDILTVATNTWEKRSGASTSDSAPATTPATTYTVDATNATVTKNGVTSTVSAIAVGDMVTVQGTVSGTTVTATSIRDGMGVRGGMKPGTEKPSASIITGNGEPVVGGSVTAINGSSLTITNKSNVTYTIDASSATITKDNATSTLSSVVVGDNVIVQGTVTGTSVTASSVIDQGVAPSTTTGTTPPHSGGFFGAIGSFFTRIFGFF